MIRVAINGFGRIGRNILRAYYENRSAHKDMVFVAINDPGPIEMHAHLLRYDSVFGRFEKDVAIDENKMVVDGDAIPVYGEKDPSLLPWGELDVDVVLECSGFFASRDKAMAHIDAGAKKVLISAPAGNDVDATIVYGVNDSTLKSDDIIVSNASCTTNCLAPLVKPLNDALGLVSGLMVTIHAYTNDQKLTDAAHKDIRRARSATQSMIPTKTGAAAAVGLVLPELNGKLDGYAIRVPTIDVSVVDLTFEAERETTIDEVHDILKQASQGELSGILDYCDEPLVSIDFKHCAASSIYDPAHTKMVGRLIKVVSWYDNEWGFSNRMLDTTAAMMRD